MIKLVMLFVVVTWIPMFFDVVDAASSAASRDPIVTIVDSKTRERTQIPWSKVRHSNLHDIAFDWNRHGQRVEYTIWLEKDWEGLLAYEMLTRLATRGELTIYLNRPTVYQDEFSRVYRISDVELHAGVVLIYPMVTILASYRHEQEVEQGRYYGFAGKLRSGLRSKLQKFVRDRFARCEALFGSD